MTDTKFYRTRIVTEVLSEGDFRNRMNLFGIGHAIDMGYCVGRVSKETEEEITSEEMATALYEFGSQPNFFQLDAEGNRMEDRDALRDGKRG